MRLILVVFSLLVVGNALAGFKLGEISDSRYVIYRAEDEEVLADITYSSRSWHLNCVNGVSFGSNNQKFDSRDMAINIAEQQCKI
jgi:hypothetical protein